MDDVALLACEVALDLLYPTFTTATGSYRLPRVRGWVTHPAKPAQFGEPARGEEVSVRYDETEKVWLEGEAAAEFFTWAKGVTGAEPPDPSK